MAVLAPGNEWTLSIRIHGLCLIVPMEPLQILLPATGVAPEHHHPGSGMGATIMKHAARVDYDQAYLQSESSKLANTKVHTYLEGGDILINPTTQEALRTEVPETVFNFYYHPKQARKRVRRDVVEAMPPKDLDARIRIQKGNFVCAERGSCWSVDGGGSQELTFGTTWEIRKITDSYLMWSSLPLSCALAPALPTLYPIDDRIEIDLYHVMYDELPPYKDKADPKIGSSPLHLRAYDIVLNSIEETKLVLRKLKEPCELVAAVKPCPQEPLTTTYSCMIATAPVEP